MIKLHSKSTSRQQSPTHQPIHNKTTASKLPDTNTSYASRTHNSQTYHRFPRALFVTLESTLCWRIKTWGPWWIGRPFIFDTRTECSRIMCGIRVVFLLTL